MKKLVKKLKDHFIPHESNDWKPHFLRHESMIFILLVVLVAELAFLVQVFVIFDKTKFLAQVLPGVLTSLTNDQRKDNNAPTLKVNSLLTQAAEMKARDMASKGYFAHTSPEGKTPWYWFDQVGYKYSYAGENLAVNFFESKDVAEAWMNSPSHRANIVKKDYTEIGIGVANGIYEGRDTVFVAQLFGAPIVSAFNTTDKTNTETKPTTTTKPVTSTTKKPAPTKKPTPASTNKVTANKPTPPVETKVLSEETSLPTTPNQTNLTKNVHLTFLPVKMFLEKIVTSPRESLTYILELIALIIFLSIILVHVIAYERRHTLGVARGLAVIALIGSILFMNFNLSKKTALKLPVDNLEASVVGSGY